MLNGAPRGQMPYRAGESAGTQYFKMDVDEWLADGGSRPLAPLEAMPQDRDLQHIVGHLFEEPLSLDVPVLHVDEEASLLVLQELVIVQELFEVPMASLVDRAKQPTDVEPVLNVPVLHTNDELSTVLGQVTLQEIPEVQVLSLGASLSTVSVRLVEQVVDVPLRGPVSPDTVSERLVEQMVDVPGRRQFPLATVSERIVEQMVDVPVRGRVEAVDEPDPPIQEHVWGFFYPPHEPAGSLDAPQGQFEGFFFFALFSV